MSSDDDDDYRPRKDDHLVEPMFSGLGVNADDDAREFLHEEDPEAEEPGKLLRWIRSARQVMRRDPGVKPADPAASRPERGR